MATPWKSNPTMHAWIDGLASVRKMRPSNAFAALESARKFFPDWPVDIKQSAVRRRFENCRTDHNTNGTMTDGTVSAAVAGLESATDQAGFQELINRLDEQPVASSQLDVHSSPPDDEGGNGRFRPIDGSQSAWKPAWVCATPGCYLRDFHAEPCTPMLPDSSKRQRTEERGSGPAPSTPIRPMPTMSSVLVPSTGTSTVLTPMVEPPVFRAAANLPIAPPPCSLYAMDQSLQMSESYDARKDQMQAVYDPGNKRDTRDTHDEEEGCMPRPTMRSSSNHFMKPTPVADRKHPQLFDAFTEGGIKAFYEDMGKDGTLVSMSTFLDMVRDGTISSAQIVTMLSIACQRIMIADEGKSGFFASGFHSALDAIGQEVIDRGQKVAPKPYVSVLLMILPKNHTASDYAFYEEMRRRIAMHIVGMLHQRRELDEKLPNSAVSSKQVLLYETAGFQLAFLDPDTPDMAMLVAPGFLGVGSHPQSEDASTFSEVDHKKHHGVSAQDPLLKIRHDKAWTLMGGTVSKDGELIATKGMVRIQPLEEIRQSIGRRNTTVPWPRDEEYMTLNGLGFNLLTILERAHYLKYRYRQDSADADSMCNLFTSWFIIWLHEFILACLSYANPNMAIASFGTNVLGCTHGPGWMYRHKMKAMHGTQLRTYGTSTNYSDICSAHVVSRGKFDNQSRGRVETSGWNKWLLHHGKLELDAFGDGSFDEEDAASAVSSAMCSMDRYHNEESIAYSLSEGKMLCLMSMGVGTPMQSNNPILFLDGQGQERFTAGLEQFLFLHADVYRHRLIFTELDPLQLTQAERKVAEDRFEATLLTTNDEGGTIKRGFFANEHVSKIIVLETQHTKSEARGNSGKVNGWLVCFVIHLPPPLSPILSVWSLHNGVASANGKLLSSGNLVRSGALVSHLYHACLHLGVHPETYTLLRRWKESYVN